jgi:hypothetical protein
MIQGNLNGMWETLQEEVSFFKGTDNHMIFFVIDFMIDFHRQMFSWKEGH